MSGLQGHGKQIRVDIDKILDKNKSIREGAIDHPDHKVGAWNWREIVSINLFDVDKKIKDFSEKELHDFLYTEGIPIEKKHGAGVYMKNYEGIIRKLERVHLNKAEDQLSEERRNAYQKYFIYSDCDVCEGSRINNKARSVKLNSKTIPDLVDMEFTELHAFLTSVKGEIAEPIVRKMLQIIGHLNHIGVGYLSLNRSVATLSGGESQRVKMARQLDCDLVDLMYILDEPSIGLHPRDTDRLIDLLIQLKEKGNSVLVVEHDADIIQCADHIIDIGPMAGTMGGEIVYQGDFRGLRKSDGITGNSLRAKGKLKRQPKSWTEAIEIKEACLHNLKNVSTKIPKGVLTCITGVAGSGKSSLINEVFLKENNEVVIIDQSPIGKSSRSNPATYIGVFNAIRKALAKETNSTAALFSFNSKGACPKCKGLGTISFEMNFMDEVKIECDECHGKRFTKEVLELTYKEKNIFQILTTTIDDLIDFFEVKEINRKLQILCDVGLGYLELGQASSTLSGGEAQRIKLASELHKKGNIYVMDEPSTGLHMADVDKLLKIITGLTRNNNTVVVIEHNLDIIRHADWIIDLGPEGGARGGDILFEGTPDKLIHCKASHTAKYLAQYYQF